MKKISDLMKDPPGPPPVIAIPVPREKIPNGFEKGRLVKFSLTTRWETRILDPEEFGTTRSDDLLVTVIGPRGFKIFSFTADEIPEGAERQWKRFLLWLTIAGQYLRRPSRRRRRRRRPGARPKTPRRRPRHRSRARMAHVERVNERPRSRVSRQHRV